MSMCDWTCAYVLLFYYSVSMFSVSNSFVSSSMRFLVWSIHFVKFSLDMTSPPGLWVSRSSLLLLSTIVNVPVDKDSSSAHGSATI